MPDVYQVARRHRKALLDGEARVVEDMVRRYSDVYDALDAEAFAWHQKIVARADELGVPLKDVGLTDPSWPFRADNIASHQTFIAKRMADLASKNAIDVDRLQQMGASQALIHAREATIAAATGRIGAADADKVDQATVALEGAWNKPDTASIEALIGQTADGTPLTSLFAGAAVTSSRAMADALTTGFVLGQNPRLIARTLRGHLGGDMTRALRIARTETIRAYRLGQTASFEANPDIVLGWLWHSALDERTCLACILKHGDRYPVRQTLSDHVQGRCAMVPETPTWDVLADRLGVPGLRDVQNTSPVIQTGTDWLNAQAPAVRTKIMGPTRAAMWESGTFQWGDFVQEVTDPVWGSSVRPTALKDMVPDPDELTHWRNKGLERIGKAPAKVPVQVGGGSATAAADVVEEAVQVQRLIAVTDATPAWVRQVSDVVGEGVTTAEQAMEAGAIVRVELVARAQKALAKATVTLPDPKVTLARAYLERTKKDLKRVQRLYGKNLTPARYAEEVVKAQEDLDALVAGATDKTGTLAALSAEVEAAKAQATARKIVAKSEMEGLMDTFGGTGVDKKAEYEAARDRFRAAGAEIADLNASLKTLTNLEDDIRHAVAKEVLAEVRPTNSVLQNWVKGGNAPVRKAIDEDIQELFPTSWLQKSADLNAMKAGKKASGGHYVEAWSGDPNGRLVVGSDPVANPHAFLDTAVHEMTHRMEDVLEPETRIKRLLTSNLQITDDPVLAEEMLEMAQTVHPGYVGGGAPPGKITPEAWDAYLDELAGRGQITEDARNIIAGKYGASGLRAEREILKPGLGDLERQFHDLVTDGRTTKKVSVYKGNAYLTSDAFPDWLENYSGKVYPGSNPGGRPPGTFWELTSTGMEGVRGAGLYRTNAGERLDMATLFPQHLDFVLGAWSGLP